MHSPALTGRFLCYTDGAMPAPAPKGSAIRLLAVAASVAAGFLFAPAAFAGSSDNVTGWAWSGTIGWISMNCINQTSCAAADYGVNIDNAPGSPDRGDLKGWAWSETMGWICFGLTCTGPTPEGGAPYAQYRGAYNGKQDQFWGWAQVTALGAGGWISLNCDRDVGPSACGASNYFIALNNVTGFFNKLAVNDHWAWSANSDGTGIGWIDMSSVNTSWVLAHLGTINRPQGVYEPLELGGACASDADCTTPPHLSCNAGLGKCVRPGTHLAVFNVSFSNFSSAANDYLRCDILLPDASKRSLTKVLASRQFNGSESLSYAVKSADSITQNTLWYLTDCVIAGFAKATVCASDAACAPAGICDTGAGKCRDVIDQSYKHKPIYAHAGVWTGLDAEQDQYLAIKCNAGFPDNYFKNAAQCDFTGDASFALAMRRGFPVEGNCTDGIDNDGNGQVDCADRYCAGISYLCPGKTLPRTSCTWGAGGDGIIDCSDPAYSSGGLCCTKQPLSDGSPLQHIVDGLECTHGDPNDGYFDCDCTASKFGVYADCFAPGFVSPDLCCDAASNVVKQ